MLHPPSRRLDVTCLQLKLTFSFCTRPTSAVWAQEFCFWAKKYFFSNFNGIDVLGLACACSRKLGDRGCERFTMVCDYRTTFYFKGHHKEHLYFDTFEEAERAQAYDIPVVSEHPVGGLISVGVGPWQSWVFGRLPNGEWAKVAGTRRRY